MRFIRVLQAGAFLAGLLILVPTVALAQKPAETDRLDRAELGLSDEQREQIRQIREQQREQLQAIRTDESLTPEERRAKARELRQQTRAQMGSVLTPEQKEKLQQQRREHRKHMKKRGTRAPGGTGAESDGSQ